MVNTMPVAVDQTPLESADKLQAGASAWTGFWRSLLAAHSELEAARAEAETQLSGLAGESKAA